MARQRTGISTLYSEVRRLSKFLSIWAVVIRLFLEPEDVAVFDAFVSALAALSAALGERPEEG